MPREGERPIKAGPGGRVDRGRAGQPRTEGTPAALLSRREQLVLSLQQQVGNQTVCRMLGSPAAPDVLQRRIKVGDRPWHGVGQALPAFTNGQQAKYQPYVLDAVRKAAEAQRDDNEQSGRTYDDSYKLYQPLIDQYLSGGLAAIGQVQPGKALKSTDDPWDTLHDAVKKEAAPYLVEVPWSTFNPTAAGILLPELAACKVQVSSNSDTTAWHGNKHQKLPKKVTVPGGVELDQVAKNEQYKYTPYVEFLIPNHKNTTGIERGILDRPSGLIYITAHYDRGSFAWLVGAPTSLVANWRTKARQYQKDCTAT